MAEPIRIGLIGCGGIVQNAHALAYLSLPDTVRVVALADVVNGNLEKVGYILNVPSDQWYRGYREMLAKADLDVVTIATPHHLHAEHAIAAVEAGVAVIIEKPMATSLDEADAIQEAAQRCGVPYTIVHNFLFTPGTRQGLELLARDQIGKPIFGRAKSMFGSKPANPTEPALIWRLSKASGGGCLNDTAYHEIYLIEALVGSPVRYVEARLRTLFHDTDVDDLVLMLLEHKNGVLSTVAASWGMQCGGAGEVSNLCEVHTVEGSLRIVRRGRELYRCLKSDRKWEQLELADLTELDPEKQNCLGHINYFAATFNALARNQPPPVPGEKGLHNLAIIDAGRRSSEERRAIEVRC